jgi:hypothetical protein
MLSLMVVSSPRSARAAHVGAVRPSCERGLLPGEVLPIKRRVPLIRRVLGTCATDVAAVPSVLKGRVLVTRSGAFQGFDSPPGRF